MWLDKNENLDGELLALSRDVLFSIPPSSLATYPEAGDLYRKLGRWVGVSPQSLLLTPGSDGAIRLVFEAFVEPGDPVAHTDPTFAMYPVYSRMFGATVHELAYDRVADEPQLDVSKAVEIVRRVRPKLLCLPNPDSPTGTIVQPEVLRGLLTECESAGTVLLVDEAYHPFHPWSAVSWTSESPNLVIARTFAKAWGAAGLRIGYAVAHPSTIELLHKMRPMYEVSTLAVEFMSRMIEHAAEMVRGVDRINDGKAYFLMRMRTLGFKVLPTHGNFLHVGFGEKAPRIHAALSTQVLYRKDFDQPCLAGYSRFSVAPKSVMSRVADLIEHSLSGTAT